MTFIFVFLSLLLPVMGEGIGSIIKAVFPSLITFPFGELIAFTMFIPFAS
ncbi:hypothetical protein [Paenibacillus sp. Soil787]|nr:hypothetical protein [Paenibacillus sp. Soil787]